MPEPFVYGRQFAARQRVGARWKTVWRLPVIRRVSDLLARRVPPKARVLDVGAGDGQARGWLAGRTLVSVDPDPTCAADHAELDGVSGPFEAALLLEVVEHLSPEEAFTTVQRIAGLLAPGGVLVVSTPNTFSPPTYLRDATHRTPFCYDELGGLLETAGFEGLELFRAYNDPLLRKLARRYLLGWLFRLLGIDFAPQVVALAFKPRGPDPA